jgi:glycosyltransferase involved in cell wall biosynthesis
MNETQVIPRFVLVTPAHNEAATIAQTIESVVSQTRRPSRWVIVSDGSTDATDSIVQAAAGRHPFLEFRRKEKLPGRNFAAKTMAVRFGVEALAGVDFDFLGFMDGDITLESDFFEVLLSRMRDDPRHGLGGGAVFEREEGDWFMLPSNYAMCAAGAMQMFRRECHEQVGGYLPLPYGGIDMMAETMARMHGWTVRSFTDLKVYHNHRQGRTHGSPMKALFRRGKMEYVNGYHPVFQCGRFFSWLTARPYGLASVVRTAGYFWALARREPIAVPREVAAYLRQEQLGRLHLGGVRHKVTTR